MEFIISFLMLVFVIVISTVLSKKFTRIPLALFQIILGALASWLPLHISLEFEPEVFMICLIAPLLFGDARVTSRKELWSYRKPIILLAIGLVIITVIGLGYFIHLLLPSLPLAAAFALAAVLSPTDAVAVKSITRGLKLPKGLMAILEGESLLNDAAGIVSFKVALAVVLTSVFSVESAALNFVFVSVGGFVAGLLLGFGFVRLRLTLRQLGFEEVNSLVAIQLITPFVIYILAEELHVSGILAVVAAGIIHGIERDRLKQTSTKIQLTSMTTWSVLSYILNGLVFVLLGFLLPDVLQGLLASKEVTLGMALGLTLVITACLFIIRYVWVYLLHRNFVTHEAGEDIGHNSVNNRLDVKQTSRSRYAFLAATCGIHGTITLATALSIPYQLPNGSPFPLRDTILFIASGVILLSLIFATVILPLISRNPEERTVVETTLSSEAANTLIINRTSQFLRTSASGPTPALVKVLADLEEQLRYIKTGRILRYSSTTLKHLQNIARDAEKKKLQQMIHEGLLSPQLEILFPIFHQPQELYSVRSTFRRLWNRFKLNRFKQRLKVFEQAAPGSEMYKRSQKAADLINELHQVEGVLQAAAAEALRLAATDANRPEVLVLLKYYSQKNQQDDAVTADRDIYEQQLKNLQLQSIQFKRDLIQELGESEQISEKLVYELLQPINYDEMLLLGNSEE
ncbi:Na+/H+ antiporter [Paenibacillus donghaensis]|uniref:Na+/H+ antiporter n=1 Tax=Paenibacillus donghaensis TaxID=414771 RepID=A0A2Z2KAE7_9BACL|nr:Na+/H+ antiporter [Paenibacillus donghaensis]ASA19880.1 Na+/H+ antiporter [Paenibacillus donghaensis]